MKKTVLCLSLLISTAAMAESKRWFKVTIKNNAYTTIKTTQGFDGRLNNLEEVFTKGFFNQATLKKGNNLLVSQKIDGKTFVTKMPSRFTLKNVATKSGQQITLVSQCTTERYENDADQSSNMKVHCKVDYDKSKGNLLFGIDDLFNTATASTSTIDCTQIGNDITCYTTNKVKPKGVQFLWKKRTAQRLAVSGTSNTLKSLFHVQQTLNKDGSESAVSTFDKKNLQPLWDKAINKMGDDEKTHLTMKIESKTSGVSISLY